MLVIVISSNTLEITEDEEGREWTVRSATVTKNADSIILAEDEYLGALEEGYDICTLFIYTWHMRDSPTCQNTPQNVN